MNNFDSVKLEFPKSLIAFNPDKYNRSRNEIEGVERVSFKLRDNFKRTGIKEILINDSNCIIQFSSKLVPELYYNMINKNTVEKYLNELNNLKLIEFEIDSIIEYGNVLSCDVTNNLRVKEEKRTYINSSAVYKVNDRYDCKFYYDESIVFIRNVKTASLKEQLTIYNKHSELMLRRNEAFREAINVNEYQHIVRIESRFLNFELMRKSFNTVDTKLVSLLNSNEKINYNILNRITDINNINIESFNNFKGLTEMKEKYKHSKIKSIIADYEIIKYCSYDIKLIELYFKTNSRANNSKYIRHYKQLIKTIDSTNRNIIDEKINEMKQLLLVA